MSIKYEGKSPSKIWYIWQNTKGLANSFFNPATKKDAQAGAKSGGISTGVLVGGGFITKIGVIAMLPIVPTVITIAVVGGAGYYGLNAYRKFKLVKNSSTQGNYIRKQEQKWLDKKTRAPFFQRVKNAIGRKIDAIPRPLLSLGKWGGIATAATGLVASGAAALHALGVSAFTTSAAATTITAGITQAGAALGLTAAAATATVIGLAVAAIPLGIALAVTARNIAYRTDPDRPHFGGKKAASAEQTQTAAPKKQIAPDYDTPGLTATPAASTTFNDNAPKQEEPQDDGLSAERKRAAAERAAARKRDRSNRF